MSAVTTHVLDTMRGEPASGVVVRLERAGDADLELGRGTTNADGRISDFGVASLSAGIYRLVFETGAYLQTAEGGPGAGSAFFPEVVVTFAADGLRPRYHVPLLLSPYSYSTYRGS
jgi:5-hydroxyisourate hydrolase